MGRLRLESRVKPLVDDQRYEVLLNALITAGKAAEENFIFWDLGPDEKMGDAIKEFRYVAEKEGISLNIKQHRKQRCIELIFEDHDEAGSARMSAEDAKKRILTALVAADGPLRKSEIVAHTGISPSTWHIRITELLEEGSVRREGHRRESVYFIA